MAFAFDGEPLVRSSRCQDCGGEHERVTGFVLRDEDPYVDWLVENDPTPHEHVFHMPAADE